MQKLYQNYTFLYSGVDPVFRATHGVGFIVGPTFAKNIVQVTHQNERSMSVTITIDHVNTTFIQAYAPYNTPNNENEK